MEELTEATISETVVLEKFEGDELVERVTAIDGIIVDRETFGKDD